VGPCPFGARARVLNVGGRPNGVAVDNGQLFGTQVSRASPIIARASFGSVVALVRCRAQGGGNRHFTRIEPYLEHDPLHCVD
jgi:hypothetical protein